MTQRSSSAPPPPSLPESQKDMVDCEAGMRMLPGGGAASAGGMRSPRSGLGSASMCGASAESTVLRSTPAASS